MDENFLKVFQLQVLLQCRFVVFAAEQADTALKQSNVTMAFFALQNLLNAAANIVPGIVGRKGTAIERTTSLGNSICITDSSPLGKTLMRNNFEHFDERIDTWWKNSETRMFIDQNVEPVVHSPESSKYDWFRNFDPVSTEVTFWGEDFNIQGLVNEVRRLLPKLESVCTSHD